MCWRLCRNSSRPATLSSRRLLSTSFDVRRSANWRISWPATAAPPSSSSSSGHLPPITASHSRASTVDGTRAAGRPSGPSSHVTLSSTTKSQTVHCRSALNEKCHSPRGRVFPKGKITTAQNSSLSFPFSSFPSSSPSSVPFSFHLLLFPPTSFSFSPSPFPFPLFPFHLPFPLPFLSTKSNQEVWMSTVSSPQRGPGHSIALL